MSGLAEIMLSLGYKVTGSDQRASETTKKLETLGITLVMRGRIEKQKPGTQFLQSLCQT